MNNAYFLHLTLDFLNSAAIDLKIVIFPQIS